MTSVTIGTKGDYTKYLKSTIYRRSKLYILKSRIKEQYIFFLSLANWYWYKTIPVVKKFKTKKTTQS